VTVFKVIFIEVSVALTFKSGTGLKWWITPAFSLLLPLAATAKRRGREISNQLFPGINAAATEKHWLYGQALNWKYFCIKDF